MPHGVTTLLHGCATKAQASRRCDRLSRCSSRAHRLRVEAALHSSRPSLGSLTVVTTVNLDRLHRLDGFCGGWAGPLIAAAYLPLTAGLQMADYDSAMLAFQDAFARYADSAERGQIKSHVAMAGCTRRKQQRLLACAPCTAAAGETL